VSDALEAIGMEHARALQALLGRPVTRGLHVMTENPSPPITLPFVPPPAGDARAYARLLGLLHMLSL